MIDQRWETGWRWIGWHMLVKLADKTMKLDCFFFLRDNGDIFEENTQHQILP